ncbi:hypothetical protein [Stenotrophomonas maltophilia]|uniref:hypothetical protein n=1 Tax=Stenotrophomonas maltophilia TaxID=40324 RepID=UPI0012B374A9|nr:hypothetical protein [Stenotrophomonas maltophilia]
MAQSAAFNRGTSEMDIVVGGAGGSGSVTVVKEKISMPKGEVTVESPPDISPIDFGGFEVISVWETSFDMSIKGDVDSLKASLGASFENGSWSGNGGLSYDVTSGTFSGTGTVKHVEDNGNIFEFNAKTDGSWEIKYQIK